MTLMKMMICKVGLEPTTLFRAPESKSGRECQHRHLQYSVRVSIPSLWCEKPVASPEAERCVLPSPELESNLRHPAYKTGALPTELSGQTRSPSPDARRTSLITKQVHRYLCLKGRNVSYAS